MRQYSACHVLDCHVDTFQILMISRNYNIVLTCAQIAFHAPIIFDSLT
jgi:hypothetical protein